MAYLSAPLWFLFLLLSTLLLAIQTLVPPRYFVVPYQLFPVWPEWNHQWAIMLFSATATLLFAPKILSALLLLIRRGAGAYGGVLRMAASTFAEAVYSMLLAPIRMLFHTRFVIATLAGWEIKWTSPARENTETTWREALTKHGGHTLLGMLWAAGVYWLNPAFLWWLLPVVGALVLSIPLSVWSSRTSLGRRLRRSGFFLIPEETAPPPELRFLEQALDRCSPPDGFAAVAVDPRVNAVACALARAPRPGKPPAGFASALAGGPQALDRQQKLDLLDDPVALYRLHLEVWSSENLHPDWRNAMEHAHATT